MQASRPPVVALAGLEPALEARLSGFLEKGGYRVAACAGLAEAAAAFGATPSDVFVGSLEAPDLQGWRLCRLLRSAEYPACHRTPILLVSTTVAGEEAARATAEAGGDELLTAPLEETRLIDAIRRLLAQGHKALAAHPDVDAGMERALREKAEDLDQFFSLSLDLLGIGETDGRILHVNPAWEKVLGYSRAMLESSRFFDFVHPDDLQATVDNVARLARQECVQDFVNRYRAKDGSYRWIEWQCSVRGTRIYAAARDITERKRIEEERETMLRLLRLLTAPSNLHELIREVTAMLQGWSGCEAVGVRLREGDDFPYFETRGFPAEFVEAENWLCARDSGGELRRDSQGNPVLECMCGNILCGRFDPRLPFFTGNGSFWTNSTTRLLASATEADRQTRTRNRCNGEGCESVALIPLRAGGQILGLLQFSARSEGRFSPETIALLERAAASIAIALEQRQTLAALRKSQERYRLFADHTYDWEFWVGPDGMPLYHSPACERITGYGAAEFMADPGLLERIVHRDDVAAYRQHARDRGSGQPGSIELRVLTKSGAEVVIDHACRPVYGDAGEFLGRRGSHRDITERKNTERERARLAEQLQQSQKLESVGRLAGGVAHAINNLLTVINSYSTLMLAGLDPRDPLHASLAEIQRSGERAADLTRQLLAFSREQVVQLKPLDLNRLITESRDMLERLIGENIELVTSLEPALGPVPADRGQLHQVIMNLAVNARDAMPNGGRLTLKTANMELGSGFTSAHPGAEPGTYVVLSVADNGAGMDPETLQRIFEPFFTTKGEGSGTGLGLATVYGIVRQCGGWITAESEPGRGARFTIGLPRSTAPATDGPPPLPPRARCEVRRRFS